MSTTNTRTESPQDRHERRKSWFLAEASRQATNRRLMARCENFYDGQQWEFRDAEEVRERGQNPVVYNEIKPSIDWLIGTERRTRVDFIVVADEPGEEADEDARVKTKLLKFLDMTNRASFERSFAAEQAFKAGMGWMEVGLRGDKSGPPVYIGAESWRNILYDSRASKRDLSDARYIFRIKVVDFDVAVALFPDKKKELEECIQTGDDADVFREWMGGTGLLTGLDVFSGSSEDDLDYLTSKPVDLFNARERVLLLECWSRDPVRNTEPNAHGIADPVTFKIHCSIMTEKHTLLESPSPFKHDRFPFIPVWAYRNSRTGLPYGPIFQLIGPQESLNHRMSRSLYEASSNQIMMEEDAFNPEVMDVEEIRRELDDPAGTAIFAKGALAGGKVKDRENQAQARAQLEFANRDIGAIRQMSGVSGEQRGLDTNSISGKAVLAKQEQGGLLTMELFDNLLFARQLEGEITLSVAEQYITGPLNIRLQGDNGNPEYTMVNEWDQESGEYRNDITKRQAHFTVGEQAWKQAFAESAFEQLMQVMTQLAAAAPQVVIAMLDVVFEMHPNLPRKQAILQRIRMVNGQTAEDGKMTPEQEQAKQQEQQMAQAQFEAQMAQLQASIREAQAKGEKLEADAMAKRLESLYMAAQAAQVLIAAPGIAPVADELAKSVGFQDMGGQQGLIDQSAIPEQPMQQSMPMEQMPMDPAAAQPLPELQQTDGARVGMQQGIQTMAPDGIDPALEQ
jgi:hypothetical protein